MATDWANHPIAQQIAAGTPLTDEQREGLARGYAGLSTLRVRYSNVPGTEDLVGGPRRIGTIERVPDAVLWSQYVQAGQDLEAGGPITGFLGTRELPSGEALTTAFIAATAVAGGVAAATGYGAAGATTAETAAAGGTAAESAAASSAAAAAGGAEGAAASPYVMDTVRISAAKLPVAELGAGGALAASALASAGPQTPPGTQQVEVRAPREFPPTGEGSLMPAAVPLTLSEYMRSGLTQTGGESPGTTQHEQLDRAPEPARPSTLQRVVGGLASAALIHTRFAPSFGVKPVRSQGGPA